jgi:signal transduction histidine kinase
LEQEDAGPIVQHLTDDATVRVDRSTMSLVIWNLIDNARKYSSCEKEITISTVREGPSILIAVEDRGIGIAAADKTRIFNKFVRVDSDSVPGTGIGLTLVRRVVEDHSGSVLVESTPGRGSTFTVALPIVANGGKP